MGRRWLSERADGVAFWIMMLLSAVFLTYSYATTQTVDWLLILVPIIGILFIFRFVWTVFAWRKISSIEMEKVEHVAFFGISLTLLVMLIAGYAIANFFNYYLLYVFVAGLLVKFILQFFSH